MKRKHILIISQYFYPEQFRINDIALEWVKRGCKVTVLTGIPNYPKGKYYKGYNLCNNRRENWNGINIIRIPLIPRGKSSAGMVLNYFSFVFSGYIWKCFTKIKADLVFTFEVSPMTQALIGVWYSKKHNVPNYLYVQDLWPDNVEFVTGITNPLVIQPINRMVDYIYRNSDTIFATSSSFVKKIRKRIIDNKEKVVFWPQYAEDIYRPTKNKSSLIPQDGILNITFTGNIGSAQGLEILPLTAALLREQNIKVRFNIVGDGRNKEKLISFIRKNKVEKYFNFIDRQQPEIIPSILSASDAAFLSFADTPIFAMTIPAKLQSYMACGIPIIASVSGETKSIIIKAKCGFVADIGKTNELAKLIIKFSKLSSNEKKVMKQNAMNYYNSHFNKSELHNQMMSCFTAEK